MIHPKDHDLIALNETLIDTPVQVTTWNSYGVVTDVKDAETLIVLNRWRELKEVNIYHIRTLTPQQMEYYKLVFDIPSH